MFYLNAVEQWAQAKAAPDQFWLISMASLHERAGRFDSNPARQTAPFTRNVIALGHLRHAWDKVSTTDFRIPNCGQSQNKFGQGFGAKSQTCPSWERNGFGNRLKQEMPPVNSNSQAGSQTTSDEPSLATIPDQDLSAMENGS